MPFPTAYALLIGIGSSAHAPQRNVPITAADASAVAAVLRDPQFCGYPPEQVTLLSAAAASRDGVLAALDGLAARVGADDTCFIFYAGHGEYGDDGYYLTTHDTHLAGRKVAVGTGIREAELIAKLQAIKAKRLLLIINACHAGEIAPVLASGAEPQRPEPVEGLTGTPLPPQVAAALLGTGAGRVIISACRANQYAFSGPGPLTLFTQALVDGLRGKGVSSNRGYISVFDLYTHLYFTLDEAVPRTVSAAVRQRYGEQQEPELTILKGDGPFAVALYRGATTRGDFDASGSPPEGTAVRTVNLAYSQAMLRQYQQSISGNAQVGAADASDTITVGNLSHVTGVAIGAGARATVYIDGRQGKRNDELLAAYYQRLANFCRSMPLQGVYEQRSTGDSLAIDLEHVYTQLATTDTVARERLAGAALAGFDVAAYLEQHTGGQRLPRDLRTLVEPQVPASISDDDAIDPDSAALLPPAPDGGSHSGKQRRLGPLPLDKDRIAYYAQVAERLTFRGPQLVSEAIAAAPRLVLLGEPGSGKSTALRYLAYTLAAAGLDPHTDLAGRLDGWTLGRLVPVFAPLLPLAKHFAAHPAHRGNAEDLWTYLVDQLQPQGANAGLAAAMHEEVEAGRVIVLLDGLDEVAGVESRRKVVRAVRAFAERYPACRIVVACRVRAYEGERNAAWQLPGWPTATLADWTLGQMLAFVHAWYRTVATLRERPDAWRDERIAGLTRAITTRDDLQRFGRQPLMLTVMALVHLNDGRLPEERASLYGRCIDILLGQWEIAGKDASEYGTLMDYIGMPDADVQSLRPLLGNAAYEAHRAATPGEVGRLSRAVLRTMIDDELKRRKHSNPSTGADRFLEYTDLRAGLIQANDAGDAYSFPHQTFQEYLAGIELFGGVDPLRRILALRNDDRWRRPILLGVEQMALSSLDLPYRLLSQLAEAPNRAAPQRAFDLLLAQEIAEDLGWSWLEQRDSLFKGLKERLAQAMANTLREPSVPARDLVRIGAMLAELGDPRPGVCDLPPAMVELPGGRFVLGLTPQEWQQLPRDEQIYFSDAQNKATLQIGAFAISRYPVTNGQYRRFIEAGGYNPEAPWWDAAARDWLARDDAATKGLQAWQRRQHKDRPEFWDAPTFGIARPNHPVVGVTWYEAMAFCRWLTLHLNDGYEYLLPSEAEWEYAARGTERRMYPWGNDELDPERASYNQTYGFTTLAVGCFPAGATPEGIYDLAGNVWEWTRSEYRAYPYDPADGREDGRNPAQKDFTLRGGSWGGQPVRLRAAYRLHDSPGRHARSVGFRLARHPPRVKK